MNRKQRRVDKKLGKPQALAVPPLDEALKHHQAGRLELAEQLYGRILAAQPNHADALYLSGVIGSQTNRFDLAVQLILRAIELNPNAASYHSHLGNALRGAGRLSEAVEACRRALALQPNYPEAFYNLANAQKGLGLLQDAIAAYGQALACKPNFPEALKLLAECLAEFPNDPDVFAKLGLIVQNLGYLDDAVTCFERAIALAPNFAAAHNNLGKIRFDQGQWEQSLALCNRALQLDPQLADAYHNQGLALQILGRWDQAAISIQQALTLRPDFAQAHNSLGSVYQSLDQPGLAQRCYERALDLSPDYAEAHTNLGQVLLLQGQNQAGWSHYEWRWKLPHMQKFQHSFTQPQWRGEPAQGRTLLIHAEQGFGDTLQFCRYASVAAAQGWRVVMLVPGALVGVMRTVPGVAAVMAEGDDLPPFDFQCPMLSLPLICGGEIPAPAAYLSAPKFDKIPQSEKSLRVGLVWAGNARRHAPFLAAVDARRSLRAEQLAPLLEVSHVQFFSLQKDGPAAPRDWPLVDLMDQMTSFADTAGLIAQLDLVISVDTAIAHLAAALGKPVWLLNRFDTCWRWLRQRDDTPWYPSLRQFRQTRPGEWDKVIERVQAELISLVAANQSKG